MKSAYLYCRVSTDEQKRKGYSLIEQEDRLVKHCEINGIQIRGIYREDYSAKNFNRPEWKKLITKIRKNRHRPDENILFVKWDRFSRNIELGYQMIRILRELNVQPISLEQPLDLEVPETIIMLAVYLATPEAENARRGLTAADGIRRAKKMGRWPGKAPIGYKNWTDTEGKKYIIPKQPEADNIKWAFEQLATGSYTISQVRRMAYSKGLHCKPTHFWKLIHNPVYCGIIKISANKNEELQFVQAIHEPLISETLFQKVQLIINKGKYKRCRKDHLKPLFPLRRFLSCPKCGRVLRGSFSQGKTRKYPYYHCAGNNCNGRFRADKLNNSYEEELGKISLRPEVYELFSLILEDENVFTCHREYTDKRNLILREMSKQDLHISKVRKFFLDEKIDSDDFKKLKEEYNENLSQLNIQLNNITKQITTWEANNNLWPDPNFNIFQSYKDQDIKGKHDIINFFTPSAINTTTLKFNSLAINEIISLIVQCHE